MEIRQATSDDADAVAPLFDAYRVFYGLPSDPVLSRAFLADRLRRGESVVFAAYVDGHAVGFVQLYPTFSSLTASRIFILNDLFVAPTARNLGVGSALLAEAERHARTSGATGMTLMTATGNRAAQRVYERLGWKRDRTFLTYEREFDRPP